MLFRMRIEPRRMTNEILSERVRVGTLARMFRLALLIVKRDQNAITDFPAAASHLPFE